MRPLLIGILLLAACETPAGVGTACTRANECSAGLTCSLGRCRVECAESRDCPLGAECVPVGAGGACRLATDVCSADSDCEPPLVCGADGACRATCLDDDACREGARCVLSGARTVCVVPEGDAGIGDASVAQACPYGINSDFRNGLEGWCIETSEGISRDVVTTSPTGNDDASARIDLSDAPMGSWVRLYQEGPLDLTHSANIRRFDADLTGGVALAPLELVGFDGSLLVRIVGWDAGSGTSTCRETGRRSDRCERNPSGIDGAPLTYAVSLADLDAFDVARVRRVAELVRTADGPLVAYIDGTYTATAECPAAWWRGDTTVASLDLEHLPTLDSGVSFATGAAMWVFPLSVCQNALRFDGSQWIERDATLPAGIYTVSTFWHGPMGAIPSGATLFDVGAGDARLFVSTADGTARLVATSGTCPDGGPRLEVLDPAALGPGDQRFQEAQVVVDRDTPRLCLVRGGVIAACDEEAAADCPAADPGSLIRLGAGLAPGTGFVGGLDELRLEAGDRGPRDASTRSGHCFVDRACSDYGRTFVRDYGSDECLVPTECTTIWTCPSAAGSDGVLECSTVAAAERVRCAADVSCPAASGACAGGCPRHHTYCEDQLAVDRAACP